MLLNRSVVIIDNRRAFETRLAICSQCRSLLFAQDVAEQNDARLRHGEENIDDTIGRADGIRTRVDVGQSGESWLTQFDAPIARFFNRGAGKAWIEATIAYQDFSHPGGLAGASQIANDPVLPSGWKGTECRFRHVHSAFWCAGIQLGAMSDISRGA